MTVSWKISMKSSGLTEEKRKQIQTRESYHSHHELAAWLLRAKPETAQQNLARHQKTPSNNYSISENEDQ